MRHCNSPTYELKDWQDKKAHGKWTQRQFFRLGMVCWLAITATGLSYPAKSADFLLNFEFSEPNNLGDGQTGACNFGGTGAFGTLACPANGDPTRIEMTMHEINGLLYFRTVIGDPATGFAQESYTRAANQSFGTWDPNSGGNERAFVDDVFGTGGTRGTPDNGNRGDPFGVGLTTDKFNLTGTGTGNPSKMVFRMVLKDSEMNMQVSKPFLNKKPRINQTVQDGAMRNQFVADARALSYDNKNTTAPVTNRLVIDDPALPVPGAADFDMSFVQHSDVDAGRFTFTPGAGWLNSGGWSASADSEFDEGTYDYADSRFNVFGIDWGAFFDPAQNQENCFGADAGITARNRVDRFPKSCFQ